MMKKVAILSNQSRSMSIFWRVLIKKLVNQGMEVICIVPDRDAQSEASLRELGARITHYRLERKGVNPLRDIQSYADLKKIFSSEKPDILFATTIKPVIYGCLAAHTVGIPHIFATITGLGYAFETDSPFKKVINRISRILYRASLKHAHGIFFQNRDDRQLFVDQGIITNDAPTFMARGTGVDTDLFAYAPLAASDEMTFLLVARLLEAKGIKDFAHAAQKLKKTWPHVRFQILGPKESGPGGISDAELDAWLQSGAVEYLGESWDVRPYMAAAHVVVLPSWREGTPTSIMEAMSMGRACIVTDVPGCREVVVNNENGFLTPVKNPDALAAAMEKFLLDPSLAFRMGQKGRQMAVNIFDANVVADNIIRDMFSTIK